MAITNGDDAPNAGTTIVSNGNVVTTVPGIAVGWIDNNRLLVNTFDPHHLGVAYAGCSIYDSSGVRSACPAFPFSSNTSYMSEFQSASADTIYSPELNSIYSVTTGATMWTSPNPSLQLGAGAIAGSHVVFASGSRVLAEPY